MVRSSGVIGEVRKYRFLLFACLVAFLFFFFFLTFGTSARPALTSSAQKSILQSSQQLSKDARILKATMLYGPENGLYEDALRSHGEHNKIHGYRMRVLRERITLGYWNKLVFVQSLIVRELQKPEAGRAEWIMWFDIDTVILNPEIPLSSFLPPNEEQFGHTNFIGSRNRNASGKGAVETGTFIVKVDKWSIELLVRAMALPMINPKVNLGANGVQRALTVVLDDPKYLPGVFYLPRFWFNARQTKNEYEGKAGNLLVRLPVELESSRWKFMQEWLLRIKESPEQWRKPFAQTYYNDGIAAFWERVRRARGVLFETEQESRRQGDQASESLKDAITHLRETITFAPDSAEEVEGAMQQAQEAMQ